MIAEAVAPLWSTHLFASLHSGWGVVLDESGGWVVGYSHFAPGVCGRYHPLAWPLRADDGCGGFRADGNLAFRGRCAFLPANGILENAGESRAEPRDVTLVIRRDGSHGLELPGANGC